MLAFCHRHGFSARNPDATPPHELGFVLVGFATASAASRARGRSIANGSPTAVNASMTYLAREPDRRFDPRRLDPRYKSVVSLGYPYAARATPNVDWRAEMRGRIAAYALGRDYHDVVKKRARAVGNVIRQLRPGSITRTYVDTGPVFEREWASAFAHRMVRQEHDDSEPRPRFVFFSRRDFHRRRIRRADRALSRSLRDLPAMPRSVSDRRARRRLRDALGPVHLVSDDRKSRRDSARAAAEARQLDLRLRHLQRRLSVERRSCV